MRMMFAVDFACIILAFTASGVAGGVEVGDWLSGGYVVTGYNAPAALKWSPSVFITDISTIRSPIPGTDPLPDRTLIVGIGHRIIIEAELPSIL